MINYKSYLDNKKLLEMAALWDVDTLNFPMTDSMACFVSVIPGSYQHQAKVLQWLMTDGMVRASQYRDRLCALLNDQEDPHPNLGKLMPLPENIANMVRNRIYGYDDEVKAEAKRIVSVGDEYESAYPADIHPCDLFSNIAREKDPILSAAASWIDIAFKEPLWIYIPTMNGEHEGYEIKKINNILRSKNLPPFKYGGVDGYLQYVEKGDWLPDDEKHGEHDRNKQHYADLSQAQITYRTDPSGKETGQVQAEFYGGTMLKSLKKFQRLASAARTAFNDYVGDNISKEIDQETRSQISNIIHSLQTQPETAQEIKPDNITNIIGKQGEKKEFELTPDLVQNKDIILEIFRKGIQEIPIRIGKDFYHHFYGSTDYFRNVEETTFRKKPCYLLYLTEQQQQDLYNYVTKDIDEGVLYVTWNWLEDDLKIRKSIESIEKVANPTKIGNWRGYFYHFFNGALAKFPDLQAKFTQNVRQVSLHKVLGIDSSSYTYKCQLSDLTKEPVTLDYIEEKLIKLGYRWNSGNPPVKGKEGALVYGSGDVYDAIKVVALDDGRFILKYPNYKIVHENDPERKFSDTSIAMLSRNQTGKPLTVSSFPSDRLGIFPLRRQHERRQLIQDLMQGDWGEPNGPVDDENDLASLKQQIRVYTKNKELIPAEKIKSDGLLALYWFTGNPAFKFGNLNKGSKRNIFNCLEKEGISPEDQEQYVRELIKKSRLKDYTWEDLNNDFPPEVVKAVGENAFDARKAYIRSTVLKHNTDRSEELTFSSMAGGDEEKYNQLTQNLVATYDAAGEEDVQRQIAPKSKDILQSRANNPEEILSTQEKKRSDCPNCGNSLSMRTSKCKCGYSFKTGKVQELPKKQCPNCQTENSPKARKCACGYSFKTEKVEKPNIPTIKPPSAKTTTLPSAIKTTTLPSKFVIPPPKPASFSVNVPITGKTPIEKVDLFDDDEDERVDLFDDDEERVDLFDDVKEHRLMNYKAWKKTVETYAVYDGKKVKDGCGYNWWGTVGDPMGVSVEGEVKVKKHKKRK
jgi:predicted Zn-ribbon and HTH transcriptional regulator